MNGIRHFALTFAMTVLLLRTCGSNTSAIVTTQYIPPAPVYADSTMWIMVDGDAEGNGADVFYVVSTWEKDWKTADSVVCHYADVWNPTHRERMAIEINRVASYMAPGNRFYAPFYRHTTIEALLNVGDIHSCEPWLYSECLQKNIAVRVSSWQESHRKGK